MGVDPQLRAMRDSSFAQFEEQGVDHVRLSLSSGVYSGFSRSFATEWLAKFDEADRAREKAIQAEMATSASRAAEAAELQARTAQKALITANISAMIAVIALIISIFSFLHN